MVRVIGRNEHLSRLAGIYRRKAILTSLLYPLSALPAFLTPRLEFLPLIVAPLATYKLYKFVSKYRKYRKGIKGESRVEEVLRELDDSYILINNVRLPEGGGNIDHVVVGPTGVFAIETKNIKGNFVCEGDNWYKIKNGKIRRIRSISRQARQNAYRLRMMLKSHGCDQFVHGIVVLTGKCKVDLINPSVPVLGPDGLVKFIRNANTKIPMRRVYEIVGIIASCSLRL